LDGVANGVRRPRGIARRGDHYIERLRLEGERLDATRQLTREKKELEFEAWLTRPDVQDKIAAESRSREGAPAYSADY
jgi:hypothetical protein